MADLLPYLQLANLAIIPAIFGLFKLVRALDKIETFMEASTKDRAAIHATLDRIERPLIAKGIIT